MQVIAIVNQKGGVGKTTLAIHLATAFTAAGRNTLLLDIDPQASAAEWKDARAAEKPPGNCSPWEVAGLGSGLGLGTKCN